MDGHIDPTKVTGDGGTREASPAKLDLVVREGRGRLGGTTFLDLLIQRAREQGRRVKPLDGDLKSRTLSALYPVTDANGVPVRDGAGTPPGDNILQLKEWIQSELNAMIEDRVSRVLDLSGGDRVMQELVADLKLTGFCREFHIGLTNVVMFGPDLEDFHHAMDRIRSRDSRGERLIMVLNEGVIRVGQTPEGAFDGITSHPDFEATLEEGAEFMILPRLSCMQVLRERGISFYDAALGRPGRSGSKVPPTVQHMTKVWLASFEAAMNPMAEWLP